MRAEIRSAEVAQPAAFPHPCWRTLAELHMEKCDHSLRPLHFVLRSAIPTPTRRFIEARPGVLTTEAREFGERDISTVFVPIPSSPILLTASQPQFSVACAE